jgi:prolyl oligopeptidase
MALRAILLGALSALLVACAQTATQIEKSGKDNGQNEKSAMRQPVAAVKPVMETFFGQSVTDPYRYMEEVKNPEVVAFLRGQADYTRRMLDSIPGRVPLAARINALAESGVIVTGVQLTGLGRVFYYKISPGETARRLYVRDGLNGAERLLFDPQSISKPGQRYAIDFYRASPDGAMAVVGVAAGGSEETSLRIINAANSSDTGVVIDRIGFADETKWAADGKSFFYNRLPAQVAGDGDTKKNRYLRSVAMRHVIGRDQSADEALFGPGVADGATFDDIDIPSVEQVADGRHLLGRVEHGDLREISLYIADTSQSSTHLRWQRVVEPKDGVTSYAVHRTGIYFLSNKDAPRFKIMRSSFAEPRFQSATTVVPQTDAVLKEMAVADDGLYIRQLVGGVDGLRRISFASDQLSTVNLPSGVAIRQMIANKGQQGVMLRLEGWTAAPKYVSIDATSRLVETRLQPKATVDFSNITEVRVNAIAKDGTKIPLSLIYKKNMVRNGGNPTLLRAYGAYGITQEPTFLPTALAWLERGGVLGTCHVRGGGEFGADWHRGGQKLTKPNSWRDLIACSEYVIEDKITSKDRLAIQGGSAGGITVGRALTERPDLFAAVVPLVGVLDALRAEFAPNGPPNIPEFGTVKTEDGFRGLLQMSSLHQVKDGTRYPAVLLMHGVNDPRVEVWHSAKMAARLQAVNAGNPSAKPVLMRLDYDAGHGVGSTRAQRNAELADLYSFLLWQFKEPEFQPH